MVCLHEQAPLSEHVQRRSHPKENHFFDYGRKACGNSSSGPRRGGVGSRLESGTRTQGGQGQGSMTHRHLLPGEACQVTVT